MFDLYKETAEEVKEIPREYKYDFKKKEIILEHGSPTWVEGVEAIKIWIYKTLLTQRGYYMAYSFEYGQDYEDLIGSGLSTEALKSEAKRMTEEALFDNENILKIEDFDATIKADRIEISFVAITTYGNIGMEVTL